MKILTDLGKNHESNTQYVIFVEAEVPTALSVNFYAETVYSIRYEVFGYEDDREECSYPYCQGVDGLNVAVVTDVNAMLSPTLFPGENIMSADFLPVIKKAVEVCKDLYGKRFEGGHVVVVFQSK